MNCGIAHDLLQQSLDGTPIESPQWLAHLRDCADCRALVSASRRLEAGLHLLPAPQPPADMAVRIVEAVRSDRRRARRRTQRRWAIGVALAASLLIALGFRFAWQGQPARTKGPPSQPVAKSAPAAETKFTPTLRESAAEVGDVFASLSNQTADETVGQTRRWVSNMPSPALPKVNLTAMEPTTPLREAGEGVSEGFQPVTTSARRAVDLFLRDLPMERETN